MFQQSHTIAIFKIPIEINFAYFGDHKAPKMTSFLLEGE
jgi:hypothetical protein